jgi:hypothetical protein
MKKILKSFLIIFFYSFSFAISTGDIVNYLNNLKDNFLSSAGKFVSVKYQVLSGINSLDEIVDKDQDLQILIKL